MKYLYRLIGVLWLGFLVVLPSFVVADEMDATQNPNTLDGTTLSIELGSMTFLGAFGTYVIKKKISESEGE